MSLLFALLNREKISMPRGPRTIHTMDTERQRKSPKDNDRLEDVQPHIIKAIESGHHGITAIANAVGSSRGAVRHYIAAMAKDGIVEVTNPRGRLTTRFHVELKK